jgi:hypothetical protein
MKCWAVADKRERITRDPYIDNAPWLSRTRDCADDRRKECDQMEPKRGPHKVVRVSVTICE